MLCANVVRRGADNGNLSNVVCYVGGNYNKNRNYGMFYTNSNNVSNYNTNIGARILDVNKQISIAQFLAASARF